MKYAAIYQVIALIMKLEPEEFWRLESEAYDINAGIRTPFVLLQQSCASYRPRTERASTGQTIFYSVCPVRFDFLRALSPKSLVSIGLTRLTKRIDWEYYWVMRCNAPYAPQQRREGRMRA